jgi:hypothetical protein
MQLQKARGYILIYTLVFGSIIVMTLGGFVTWGVNYLKVANHTLHQEESARISEAGIQYYKWHLAHAPNDFQDGTGAGGPYVHDYKDKDGNTIGTFTLTVTPPVSGSNIVTIESEGTALADPTAKKKVRVKMAPESIAKYAVLSDSSLYFPTSSEIFGPVHSNNGIRFDGLAHNIVTSSRETYRDETHGDDWDDDEDNDEDEDDEDDEDSDDEDEDGEYDDDDEDDDTDQICHIPPGNPGNRRSIEVSEDAVAAHLAHGDHRGQCDDDDDDHDDDGDGDDNDDEDEDHHSGGHDNDEDDDGEDDDYEYQDGYEYAVHTHKTTVDPLPPTTLPSRPDVFTAGRQFPVPTVDLETITNSLSALKTSAQSGSGFFRTASGKQGYKVVLKNNDTFDLYEVKNLVSAPSGCSGDGSLWGTWSVNQTTSLGNFPFPTNGIMYFEDHVWVEGKISTAKLTIVAAALTESESNQKNIIIGGNTEYTTYTGNDSLALIAQSNVLFAMTVPTTLRVDGALIAKNGKVTRLGYRAPERGNNRCSPYHSRTAVTLWGMIAAKYGFSLSKSDGTGFQSQQIYYDGNLITAQPPGVPALTPQYKIVSYEELN